MCDVANNSAPENIKRDLTRISEVLVPDRTLKAWKNAWFFSKGCSKNLEFFTLTEKLTKIYLSKKIRNKLSEILSKSDDYTTDEYTI